MTEGRTKVVAAFLEAQNDNVKNNQTARINDVLETMIGQPLKPQNLNALASYSPPVPNFVNLPVPPAYKDLRDIIKILEIIEKNLSDAISSLKLIDAFPEEIARCDRISSRISHSSLDSISIILLIGPHHSSIVSNMITQFGVSVRLTELRELQRAHYPAGKGRKKNAHAYLVAEKLARFYANRCNKRPSYGTGDGGIPSTEYTRALEKIFEILGIQATLRGPAESAIAGLTDSDLNPMWSRFNALAGVFGPPTD